SQAIQSLGIYWINDGTYITTTYDPSTKAFFQSINERGWRVINNSLYYFAVYPYLQQAGEINAPEYIVGVQLKTDYLKSLLPNAISGENSNAYFWINKELLWSNNPVLDSIDNLVELNTENNIDTT